jgi:hypothetical protein
MTMIERVLGAALLVLLSATGQAADTSKDSAPAAEETRFSEAEKLLWMGDQLKAVRQPATLHYSFARAGTYEQGFTDSVVLQITRVKANGLKDGTLQFFSGDRNFPVPPAEDTDANPVLKIYFQGDVYEMNRLTDPDGKSRERWRYFQRRVKLALSEAATVTPTSINFAGQPLEAKAISFQPYHNDPKRAEFEQFADKRYTVVVSDKLPGYLYSIETFIPGPAGAPPLIQETLKLETVEQLPAGTTSTSPRSSKP